MFFQGEEKMNDQADQKINQQVDLEAFANMVGFPAELIKKELFHSDETKDTISMDELRSAMVKYLDSTMINNS